MTARAISLAQQVIDLARQNDIPIAGLEVGRDYVRTIPPLQGGESVADYVNRDPPGPKTGKKR